MQLEETYLAINSDILYFPYFCLVIPIIICIGKHLSLCLNMAVFRASGFSYKAILHPLMLT